MPYTLELPDSELRDVAREGALVRVRLSAAAARNDAGERGWLTSVTLQIAQATLAGDATHAFGKIIEGALRHGGDVVALTPPDALQGAIELSLRLANGTQFALHGDRLAATLADDARFTADLSC